MFLFQPSSPEALGTFCASTKPQRWDLQGRRRAEMERCSALAAWGCHQPLVPVWTHSGPNPEQPGQMDGWDHPHAHPQVPLTIYCPSFSVSSSSRSCCLRTWKSSSERKNEDGAVAVPGHHSLHYRPSSGNEGPGLPHPDNSQGLGHWDCQNMPGNTERRL